MNPHSEARTRQHVRYFGRLCGWLEAFRTACLSQVDSGVPARAAAVLTVMSSSRVSRMVRTWSRGLSVGGLPVRGVMAGSLAAGWIVLVNCWRSLTYVTTLSPFPRCTLDAHSRYPVPTVTTQQPAKETK